MTWLWLVTALAGAFLIWRAWRRARRQLALAQPFPESWRRLLHDRLPHYSRLTPEQRERLHARIQYFLADKRFYGCNGLRVTDEMRVLIAGLACLLVLRPDAKVFPRLLSVLVYPRAFWVRHEIPDELGLVSTEPELHMGEAWQAERVVLSWEDVEAALEGDAVNVVAHEFAHLLDDENPGMDGAPRLPDYRRWSGVMKGAYDELCASGSPVIDDYGTEGPAEFFAVATEAYFQRGAGLRRHHRELYELLRDYFVVETGA
jgi:Mlc titration factor MtfA (ptsG expression regulator)